MFCWILHEVWQSNWNFARSSKLPRLGILSCCYVLQVMRFIEITFSIIRSWSPSLDIIWYACVLLLVRLFKKWWISFSIDNMMCKSSKWSVSHQLHFVSVKNSFGKHDKDWFVLRWICFKVLKRQFVVRFAISWKQSQLSCLLITWNFFPMFVFFTRFVIFIHCREH